VLRKVLGEPPNDVLYTRWIFDEEKNENVVVTYPQSGVEIEMSDVAVSKEESSSKLE